MKLVASLAAVGEARLEVPTRVGEPSTLDRDCRNRDVGVTCPADEPFVHRLLHIPLEHRVVAAARGDRQLRKERELSVAEALRQHEPARAPREPLVRPRRRGGEEAEVGIRRPELAARRQGLEQSPRVPAGTIRFGDAAGTPEELREPAKRIAFTELVAHLATAFDGFFESCDALVVLVGDQALAGAPLEEVGAFRGGQAIAEAQRAGVLGCGLAVSAQGGRVLGRRDGEAQNGGGVARLLRMVCEPRRIE